MGENIPADAQGKIVVFGAKRIRRIWQDEQWFFSVVDIIAALTDSDAPSKYWPAMKRREQATSGFQLSTICRQLKMTSADGKSYTTDAVNTQAAREGGSVAGSARRQLEAKSGRKVVTSGNYLIDKPKLTKG